MSKYIAVIPARGGSKRLPRKNILPLAGIPLVAHSILYARQCPEISKVYVSTDDPMIKEIAMRYEACVLDRPAELSDDYTTTAEVLQDVTSVLLETGETFDYLILLQATNPLRPKGLISEAIGQMIKGRYDSLMTVTPTVRKLGHIQDGRFQPFNYTLGQRSQDMAPLYYENGLLYISAVELVSQGCILGNHMLPMIVDHVYGTVDIDTSEDMKWAEYLMRYENRII